MAETTFTIRRKVFSFFTQKFHIYDENEKLLGYSEQKAFKLKEDIRIFADEEKTKERIIIKARQILDISAAYDVQDAKSGEKVGALQRQGLKSMIRDSWIVMDTEDEEVGKIQEDSMGMALFRRFMPMGNLIPQKYKLTSGGDSSIAEFRQNFNPFIQKLTVTVYDDCPVSKLLVVAAGVLLVAIEGRQG